MPPSSLLQRASERAFAAYYPWLLERAERAGQREIRRELIALARGRTLELGAGSGINLPHYPPAVTELVLSEPSPDMLRHLRRALSGDGPRPASCELLQAPAEATGFAEASFDTIVGTFILCTTPEPDRVLAEIHRLLRPGGSYLFYEHVHAGEGSLLGAFQDLVETPHTWVAAGCHPNRRTEALLAASSLEIAELRHGRQPRAVPTVRPTIIGRARRAGD